MKRIQLFEFEDQKWFGPSFRVALTKVLEVLDRVTGLHGVLAHELDQLISKTGQKKLFDYGSGSGGAMPETLKLLKAKYPDIQLELSDLFPDEKYAQIYNDDKNDSITYNLKPVDASNANHKHDGIKTLINSFHHLTPEVATKVLKTAQDNNDTIIIYEMAENKIPTIIWWLGLPIGLVLVSVMALLLTPFVKKLTLHQLFFTYLIPIIPLCYAWDGQASMPRIYTREDIQELLNCFERKEGYEWTIRPALNTKNKPQGYVIIGQLTMHS